jgi:hypothetical protein
MEELCMSKRIVTLIVLGILLMNLVGCKDKVMIARPLISSQTDYQAYDVATAIGPDGTKHFIWSECDPTGKCHLVYARSYLGELNSFLYYYPYQSDPGFQPQFVFPDIAVGGDGYVYLVWHYIQEEDIYYDCWQMIAPDDPNPYTSCGILQDTDLLSTHYSHPQVVALDSMAYAVFEQVTESGEFLYYIKLRTMYDGVHGRVSSITPGLGSNQPQAALSSYPDGPTTKYVLHVLWTSLEGVGSSTTYYNDNYGITGDMNAPISDSLTSSRSHPALAVDNGSGDVIGLFFVHAPVNDHNLKAMYCPAQDCKSHMTWKSSLLDGLQDWSHEGTLGMAIQGDIAYFSFIATTAVIRATSGFTQVFTGSYQAGAANATGITQVTNKNIQKSSPLTVRLDFGSGSGMNITGWREKTGSGYFQDVYVYVQSIIPYTQQIFSRQYSTFGGSLEMSARGTWVSGIWNCQVINEGDRLIPWYSMNIESTNLPVIRKP